MQSQRTHFATSLQPSPSMILRVLTRSGPMLTALCRRERLAVEEAAISISLYRGKVVLDYDDYDQ